MDVDVDVTCSSGTYIRAIARDLGATLGVGGHLTALRRTAVGGFTLAEAQPMEALEERAPDVVNLSLAEAARRVDRGAGVALLADLGSAVLTVRSLLEEGELPEHSRLLDAPFVEGAVAAVVAALAGADLEAVADAAAEAHQYRKG